MQAQIVAVQGQLVAIETHTITAREDAARSFNASAILDVSPIVPVFQIAVGGGNFLPLPFVPSPQTKGDFRTMNTIKCNQLLHYYNLPVAGSLK